MKELNDAYKDMQAIMAQTKDTNDNNNNNENAQVCYNHVFRSYWLDYCQSDRYPTYARLLAKTTPQLEEILCSGCFISSKFIVRWNLPELLETETHEDDPNKEDSITNLYKKIRAHDTQAEYLTVILENDDITCFVDVSSHDYRTDITDMLKDYRVMPSKKTYCHNPNASDKETTDEDEINEPKINRIDYSDMFDSAYDILHRIVHTIAQRTNDGRNFNSLSRKGAYTLCQSLFSAISNNKGAIPIKNPCEIWKTTGIEDCDDIYAGILFDDIHNIYKLFGSKDYETPYNILTNIFTQIKLCNHGVDMLSEVMAEIMCEQSFGINNDTKNVHPLPEYTPSQIYDMLSETVVNQDAALKAASMFIYNHVHGHGRNMLMVGPTGCGKTEIWRKLASIYPCISIIDGSRLTADGWKGDCKLETAFLLADSKYTDRLILVIDEADKMMEPAVGAHETDYSLLIQNELLKLMDHKKGNIAIFTDGKNKQVSVDCSKISIVLCGSFSRMVKAKEQADKSQNIGFIKLKSNILADMNPYNKYTTNDLIQYANVRDEVAGRINQIVELNSMETDDFMTIINHATASPIHQLEKEMKLKIHLNESAKQKLAELAATSKLGCRVINARLIQCLDAMMFEQPDCAEYDLSDAVEKSFNQ